LPNCNCNCECTNCNWNSQLVAQLPDNFDIKCKTSIWSLYSHLAQVFAVYGMKINHIC